MAVITGKDWVMQNFYVPLGEAAFNKTKRLEKEIESLKSIILEMARYQSEIAGRLLILEGIPRMENGSPDIDTPGTD